MCYIYIHISHIYTYNLVSYGVLLVSSEPRSEVKAEGSDCEDAPGNAVDVIFAPEVYANPCLSNILRLYLTYF